MSEEEGGKEDSKWRKTGRKKWVKKGGEHRRRIYGLIEEIRPSSAGIRRLRAVPMIPAHAPNSRYRVPMSLWFVEKSQRLMSIGRDREKGRVKWLSKH